jgi:hypothetical protein
MPWLRSSEKTATASVEPTMAPTSKPCMRLRSSAQAAMAPVMAAVTTTPSVASDRAGLKPRAKLATRVRRPPSKRITARAMLPTV